MSDSAQMLTTNEVADILGVHQKTVHMWLRSGKLHGIKISYRAWRIPKESLDSFIKANSNKSGKTALKLPTSTTEEHNTSHQATLVPDKKESMPSSQLKMKYYIQDIMNEDSNLTTKKI
jgi:excisionase family DNA binding protein